MTKDETEDWRWQRKLIRTKTNYAENTKIMTIMIDDDKDEKRGLLSTKTYDDDKEDWWWQRKLIMTKKTYNDKDDL